MVLFSQQIEFIRGKKSEQLIQRTMRTCALKIKITKQFHRKKIKSSIDFKGETQGSREKLYHQLPYGIVLQIV